MCNAIFVCLKYKTNCFSLVCREKRVLNSAVLAFSAYNSARNSNIFNRLIVYYYLFKKIVLILLIVTVYEMKCNMNI